MTGTTFLLFFESKRIDRSFTLRHHTNRSAKLIRGQTCFHREICRIAIEACAVVLVLWSGRARDRVFALSCRLVQRRKRHPRHDSVAAPASSQKHARMASRASGVSAESHSDQSAASATSRRVAEPPAVPTVAPFEGFQFIQNLATQTSGRQASHESVGAWGVAALCGSAATTATLTAFVKSRSKAERDLPKGTHAAPRRPRSRRWAWRPRSRGGRRRGARGRLMARHDARTRRRSLRGATRGAIAATGVPEPLRRTQ